MRRQGVVGVVQGRPPRADSDRGEEPSRPRGEHWRGHVRWGWAAASRSPRRAEEAGEGEGEGHQARVQQPLGHSKNSGIAST